MKKPRLKQNFRKKLTQLSFISFMLLFGFLTSISAFSIPLSIDITYLKLHKQHAPALSNIIKMASDSGYQGAKLAIEDSNTTGKFFTTIFFSNIL